MSWKKTKHWYAEQDARCDALVARAKRPSHDNAVTVRWVEPTMPKRKGSR